MKQTKQEKREIVLYKSLNEQEGSVVWSWEEVIGGESYTFSEKYFNSVAEVEQDVDNYLSAFKDQNYNLVIIDETKENK